MAGKRADGGKRKKKGFKSCNFPVPNPIFQKVESHGCAYVVSCVVASLLFFSLVEIYVEANICVKLRREI